MALFHCPTLVTTGVYLFIRFTPVFSVSMNVMPILVSGITKKFIYIYISCPVKFLSTVKLVDFVSAWGVGATSLYHNVTALYRLYS
jgi:hypothetical protein